MGCRHANGMPATTDTVCRGYHRPMSSDDHPDTLSLSFLLRRPIRGPQGEALGKLQDLVARIGADAYPPVIGLVLRTGSLNYFVPWSQVASVSAEGIRLTSARVDLRGFARRENELLLHRDLLDRKVIDVEHRQVVRVNDVLLRCQEGTCRLAGIDAGLEPVARRLGVERLVERLRLPWRKRPLEWPQVEFFASDYPVRLAASHAKTADMHPADIAEMMESVSLRQGHEILDSLDDETAADTLEEMSPERQADLMEALDDERAADLLEKMEPDDAADLLADLPEERVDDILERMEPEESEDVRELLQYPERSAGGLMTNDLVAVPRSFTAGEVLENMRARETLPEMLHDIYVVASREDARLVGVVPLRKLLVSPPERPLGEIMETDVIRVSVDENDREVARIMARYDLLALPVVDNEGILLGIVTVDDAMEIILPDEWKKRLPRVFR